MRACLEEKCRLTQNCRLGRSDHCWLVCCDHCPPGAIESLLSALVADGMIDDRRDSNQELMAQGIANIFCPLFGGIAATGASTDTEGAHHSLVGKDVSDEVLIFHIFGAFFIGVADKLEAALKRARQEPRILILRMRKVLAMDATGLNALDVLYEKLHHRNQHLILSGPHAHPYMMMDRAGFLDQLGRENVCADIDAALKRAREILNLPVGFSTSGATRGGKAEPGRRAPENN
jgi:MFS superfamily sulfate permease-like transporter